MGKIIAKLAAERGVRVLNIVRREAAVAELTAEGIGDERLDGIDRRCREDVEDAVAFAEASPWPDPATVTDGVYAP